VNCSRSACKWWTQQRRGEITWSEGAWLLSPVVVVAGHGWGRWFFLFSCVLPFHAAAFPFSSPLRLSQLPPVFLFFFYYLLVAVAATGTADGGWETRWQLLWWWFCGGSSSLFCVPLSVCFCSPVALTSAAPSSVSNDGGAAVVGGAAGWWLKATVEREEQLLGTREGWFFSNFGPENPPCFCFVPSLFLPSLFVYPSLFFSKIPPLFLVFRSASLHSLLSKKLCSFSLSVSPLFLSKKTVGLSLSVSLTFSF